MVERDTLPLDLVPFTTRILIFILQGGRDGLPLRASS
jgi:hypothetical protein